MKTLEHIEMLLKQGKKTKELIELGFAKQAITWAKRRLKDKAEEYYQSALNHTQDVSAPNIDIGKQTSSLHDEIAVLRQKLGELEAKIGSAMTADEVQELFNGTPVLNLRSNYVCKCGAKGMVAIHFKCTDCNEASWWGWHLKSE